MMIIRSEDLNLMMIIGSDGLLELSNWLFESSFPR